MSFERNALQTRFGRRLLLVFGLSAMLPLAVMAAIGFVEIRSTLLGQSSERLEQSSRALREQTLANLLAAERELRALVALPDLEAAVAAVGDAGGAFAEARLVDLTVRNDGAFDALVGKLEDRPISGDVLGTRSVSSVWLAARVPGDSATAVVVLLHGDWLFGLGGESFVPASMTAAFLGPGNALLFGGLAPEQLPRLALQPRRYRTGDESFEWTVGEEDFVGVYRAMPLPQHLGMTEWGLVLAEPRDAVLLPVARFSRMYPIGLFASLCIVLLLGVRQIRRELVPLQTLRDGTQRLGSGDLGARVEVRSADEFEQLADSFNEMATRLEGQFGLLSGLSTIQRTALESPEPGNLHEAFCREVPASLGGDGIALLALDDAGSDRLIVSRAGKEHSSARNLDVGDRSRLRLALHDGPRMLGPDEVLPEVLADLELRNWKWRLVMPVRVEDELQAVVCVGFVESPDDVASVQDVLVRYVDELALALSRVQLIGDLNALSWGTMSALARAIDAKSSWTTGHSRRVTDYAMVIGREYGLAADELEVLERGALLHDVGKIGIPAKILDKPGALDARERETVELHPVIGARILEPIEAFTDCLPIVRHHHERWDGRGYPDRLAGTEVHLLARICAVADVFDAMTSDRPYRRGMEPVPAAHKIAEEAGTAFDPDVVHAFLRAFRDGILGRYQDRRAS